MSGEAILSAENSGKPSVSWGITPNTAGGAHSALPDPLAGGEWVAISSPRTPPPTLGLQPFGLAALPQ